MAGPATFKRWPDFPRAATTEHGRLGHGRGSDASASRQRALGEMVETASCCAWGDEEIFDAPYLEVADQAWGPDELTGFADWQRRDRADWNARFEGLDWIPPVFRPDIPIGWMTAKRLETDADIYLPADNVLIGRRARGDIDACAVADTNGCAAGVTREAALIAALYELIERDAVALWWYGQRPSRQIDPSRTRCGEAVVQSLADRGRLLWLMDITSDIRVPTVAAVASDLAGRRIGVGFATRAKLEAAAHAAMSELMQIELKIAAAIEHPDLVPDLAQWFREIDFGGEAPFGCAGEAENVPSEDDIEQGLSAVRALLSQSGCRIAVIDMTRPQFGIPAYRAVSPDLCHWKPRFGRTRLIDLDRGASDGGCSANPASLRPFLRV